VSLLFNERNRGLRGFGGVIQMGWGFMLILEVLGESPHKFQASYDGTLAFVVCNDTIKIAGA
jgi:hypothetical protein